MNDGVMAYFFEEKLVQWVELGFKRLRLRYNHNRLDVIPVASIDDSRGDWHDIDLRYADGICRITDRGGIGTLYLERAATAERAPGPEPLRPDEQQRLEDGDRLRFHTSYIRYIATSQYLQYLPPPYQSDTSNQSEQFTGRFLMIFESMLDPIAQTIAQIDQYFDPHTAPASLLPYLLSWFGLWLDAPLDLGQQRTLLSSALEINRWRSTRHGLRMHIKACCGIDAEIIEWSDRRAGDAMPRQSNSFTVILPIDEQLPESAQLIQTVAAIARMHRPMHTNCEIWTRNQDNKLQLQTAIRRS